VTTQEYFALFSLGLKEKKLTNHNHREKRMLAFIGYGRKLVF